MAERDPGSFTILYSAISHSHTEYYGACQLHQPSLLLPLTARLSRASQLAIYVVFLNL